MQTKFLYFSHVNIKVCEFCFRFHFDSSSDASNWKMAIEESISCALGDDKVSKTEQSIVQVSPDRTRWSGSTELIRVLGEARIKYLSHFLCLR